MLILVAQTLSLWKKKENQTQNQNTCKKIPDIHNAETGEALLSLLCEERSGMTSLFCIAEV